MPMRRRELPQVDACRRGVSETLPTGQVGDAIPETGHAPPPQPLARGRKVGVTGSSRFGMTRSHGVSASGSGRMKKRKLAGKTAEEPASGVAKPACTSFAWSPPSRVCRQGGLNLARALVRSATSGTHEQVDPRLRGVVA